VLHRRQIHRRPKASPLKADLIKPPKRDGSLSQQPMPRTGQRLAGELSSRCSGRLSSTDGNLGLPCCPVRIRAFRCTREAFLRHTSGNRFVAKPFFSHRFAHQRTDNRRIESASDRDQVYFSPELGLKDRQRDDAGMPAAFSGMKAKPSPAATMAKVKSSRSLQ